MLTAVFDICDISFDSELSNILSSILFLVWIVDINNIQIIFNVFCSHATVILMKV